MSVINIAQTSMHSHLVGLLSYGKFAGLSASDLNVPHPDNVTGWEALAVETVASVCATLEVRLNATMISGVASAYRNNAHKSEKHAEAMRKITQALDFNLLTPEDDFPEYKASDVKKTLTKLNGLVDKIVEANGSLVLIYLCYLLEVDTTEDLLYNFAVVMLDGDDDSIYRLDHVLTGCNAVLAEYKKWDRALVKNAKTYDFVELTVEDAQFTTNPEQPTFRVGFSVPQTIKDLY